MLKHTLLNYSILLKITLLAPEKRFKQDSVVTIIKKKLISKHPNKIQKKTKTKEILRITKKIQELKKSQKFQKTIK